MNGIGMIIPGADFSGSPLGQVTVVKTAMEKANEIVAAYKTATGITDTTAVFNFVYDLINANLWDNIGAFFPMLGSTLSSQLVELKDPTRSAWQGANFSTNVKGIAVANNIDAGLPEIDSLWSLEYPFIGYTQIASYSCDDNEVINVHPCISHLVKDSNDGSEVYKGNLDTLNSDFATGYTNGGFKFFYGLNLGQGAARGSSHRCIGYNTSEKMYYFYDGSVTSVNITYGSSRSGYAIKPVFGISAGSSTRGGTSISRKDSDRTTGNTYVGQRALDGIMHAIGFAKFDSISEVENFDSLFATFLSESGKIESA